MAPGNGRSGRAAPAMAEEHPVTTKLLGMETDEFDALMTEHEVEQLQERIAEMEFLLEDTGWERVDGSNDDLDLSRDLLRRIIRDARAMYLANPLINHSVDVIAVYVFGQGVTISGHGIANDRVQAFLDDIGNVRTLTGLGSMLAQDRALTYEGNRFYALFGKAKEVTRVRNIPTLQMVAGDIIRNPEDDAEVWYYMRRWTRTDRDDNGATTTAARVDYYPDIHYAPSAKPKRYGAGTDAGDVHWDSPVVHIKDGGLTGAKYGMPTNYSALTWARAVSRDLSDYATVKRALARFAWKFLAKTRAGARSAQQRIGSTVTVADPIERNPAPSTASMAFLAEGNDLAPIKTAGSAPNPEEGRRLGLMVAAGAGVPETILFGNADAGSLATAKTLDRPTELMMSARQGLWQDLLIEVIGYDLRRAVTDGSIPSEEPDPDADVDGDAIVDATGMAVTDAAPMRPVDVVPDIAFVDILEDDVTARISAIVEAATLGAAGQRADTIPDDLLSRLLMTALGVEDIDEVIERMFREPDPDPLGGLLDDPAATPAERQFAEALDAFTEHLVTGNGVRPPGPRGTGRGGRTRRAHPAPSTS